MFHNLHLQLILKKKKQETQMCSYLALRDEKISLFNFTRLTNIFLTHLGK